MLQPSKYLMDQDCRKELQNNLKALKLTNINSTQQQSQLFTDTKTWLFGVHDSRCSMHLSLNDSCLKARRVVAGDVRWRLWAEPLQLDLDGHIGPPHQSNAILKSKIWSFSTIPSPCIHARGTQVQVLLHNSKMSEKAN